MPPQIVYLQMMAQRFAGTPIGQMFQQRFQQAMDGLRMFESRWPSLARGPGGQFPARTAADKVPLAPVGRGLAGAAGVGAVASGGPGTFEGVRDRLFSDLDARGTSGPEVAPQAVRSMDSTLFGEDAGPRPAPMRVADSTLSGYDAPAPVRRAVQVARSVMPQEAPMPPRRPVEAAPAAVAAAPARMASGPSSRDLWEIYNQTESPADFARADAAMRAGRAEGGGIPEGMMGMRGMDPPMPPMDLPPPSLDFGMPSEMPAPKPAGSGAGGSSAAINKALEIIHHLVVRRG